MKNVFGLKKNKKSIEKVVDGSVFRTNQIYSYQESELDNDIEVVNEVENKGALPKSLSIVKYLTFFIGLLGIGGIFKADVSLATGYQNAPYIYYLTGICLIITIVLFIIEKLRNKKVTSSEQYLSAVEKFEQDINKSQEALGIPEDTNVMDVFTFTYKENNKGKIIINTSGFFKYMNMQVFVYIKNNALCFANLYEEYSIPLDSLVEIRKINKKAMVQGWNKEESPTSKRYKKYKIRANNFGTLYIKPYYSIIINDNLGEFEILVPCYDIDEIIKLTNLNIKEVD